MGVSDERTGLLSRFAIPTWTFTPSDSRPKTHTSSERESRLFMASRTTSLSTVCMR